MTKLEETELREMSVGDEFVLGYTTMPSGNEVVSSVKIDDITEFDICCEVLDGEYAGSNVSLMLQDPHGKGGPWPIDLASNGRDRFKFYKKAE